MKSIISTLTIVLLTVALHAQTGEITGKVTDMETGMSLPEAHIIVKSDGIKVMELSADMNGVYVCKPLKPAIYDLFVIYMGYDTAEYNGIQVKSNGIAFLDVQMSIHSLGPINVYAPLISRGDPGEAPPITEKEIRQMGSTSVIDIVYARSPMVYQNEQTGGLSMAGSREDATLYVVDGVKVIGSLYVPLRSIKEISVITGGIPAKYGDVTGGIVEITTKNYNGIF